MGKQLIRRICKNPGCGKEFFSTDLSARLEILRGLTPTTRCDECRQKQKAYVRQIGLPYFEVLHRRDDQFSQRYTSGLGSVDRDISLPEVIEYPGVPTDEALAKFLAVAPTIDKIVECVLDPTGPRFILAIMPTGTGKSVFLPYRLLTSQASLLGKIFVTEPRLSVLKAKEPGGDKTIPWYIGTQLLQAPAPGYGKGFEVGAWYAGEQRDYDERNNRLVFVSDGLLRVLASSGALSDISVLVIDEAHEKSENMVALYTLLRVIIARYPKLKVIFASATIDPAEFVEYYKPARVAVFQPQGISTQEQITVSWPQGPARDLARLYNQRTNYAGKLQGFKLPEFESQVPQAVATLVKTIRTVPNFTALGKPMGDIIVFVATKKVIKAVQRAIAELGLPKLKTYVCHRDMNSHERNLFDASEDLAKAALERGSEDAVQRVIIATNYVQTGITITARYVIDSGYVLEPRWRADVSTREYLVTTISQDAALQRWGRISRLIGMPGEVFPLYLAENFELWPAYTAPEVTRTNLDKLFLTLASAGLVKLKTLKIFGVDENDPAQALEKERALRQLALTGAVDQDGDVTRQGYMIQDSRTSLVNYALLLINAEELACLLEVAVFLAFIERDGSQSLFEDSERGIAAYERWRTGVTDDLEFYLRLYVHWQRAGLEARNSREHAQWSADQGLNHDAFRDVERSRDALLLPYQKNVHTSVGKRQLDLKRIHRIRAAIARAMTEWIYQYQEGQGPTAIYSCTDPNCPPAAAQLFIDRESACLTRSLNMFVCIDRTLVNGQLYARHVVQVSASWMGFLRNKTVAMLILVLEQQMKEQNVFTHGVEKRLRSVPPATLSVDGYQENTLLNVSVVRVRPSEGNEPDTYLVTDLDREQPVVISTKTRVSVGESFRTVIEAVDRTTGVLQVSQKSLISQAYKVGNVVTGTAVSNLTEADGDIHTWFLRLESGIDARLRQRSFGFFREDWDAIAKGSQLKVEVFKVSGTNID